MRIGIIGAGHIGGTLADPVDAGTLAEGGRKHQPGTSAYSPGMHTAELRVRLAT